MIVTKEIDQEGNVTITQTIRKTYSQDWKNYNFSQQHEKEFFMKLLADITSRIQQPAYTFGSLFQDFNNTSKGQTKLSNFVNDC